MLSKLFFAFILLLSTAVYAQQSQGKVYAEDKPLEGVLIINKTQDLMTSTNRWGTFEIAAQLGDSLIFSYSFFETQNINKNRLWRAETCILDAPLCALVHGRRLGGCVQGKGNGP